MFSNSLKKFFERSGRNTQSIKQSNGRSTITINGRTTVVEGNDVSVIGNNIYVSGKKVETISGSELGVPVKIEWTGDLASLDCTNATINGNVQGNVDGTNINITGNVGGDVDGTNIKCHTVKGDVDGVTINMNRL